MTRTRFSRLFLACTLAILWCGFGAPATAQEPESVATEAAPGQNTKQCPGVPIDYWLCTVINGGSSSPPPFTTVT